MFDITDDELPIFLAETNEHLQVLEEGLVRLEREDGSPELIQALFRAAHTLKGAAGMIGHKRMVDLTHVLETVLDGIRKGQVQVVSGLIDTCLETVDALRLLCDEVPSEAASPVEIDPLIDELSRVGGQAPAGLAGETKTPGANSHTQASDQDLNPSKIYNIRAQIAQDSIASAARALQLMMALQDLGEIVSMKPDQAHIEAALPVSEFQAQFIPDQPVDAVRKTLEAISEVDQVEIAAPAPVSAAGSQQEADLPGERDPGARIGELLFQHGLVTQDQLNEALRLHENDQSPASLIGKTLVKMGAIDQEVLDEVVAEQKRKKAGKGKGAEANSEERTRSHTVEKTIRTSVERLDTLLNLVGELITDRNRLNMIRRDLEARFRGDGQVETLSETITHVGRITDQLQAEVMGIRMLPIANVFNKFPRMVRDLAQNAGKQVDLVIRGEETELDRSVIEEISDPLIHLLRNAVDHGLETQAERLAAGKAERGTILLTARHEQGRIILTVEDDGKGIDVERLRAKAVEKGLMADKEAAALTEYEAIDLIFLAGFSTARVVSDVSGRGVGMDIVRNNIERLNGSIVVETWEGKGTQFQIVLPLTLAIVPTLLVRVGNGTYAIPLAAVTETLRVAEMDIQTVNGRPVIVLREHVLPVQRLADIFGVHHQANGSRYKYIVVVRSGKSLLGVIVDGLVGEQEVVVKSLSSVVGDVVGISSAAILGDGRVALIIEVQGLFKLAAQHQQRV